MENMANRECCDVDIRDYYTNAPIMLIDFCNANTAEFSSDSITVRRNGVKFLRFDSPIESTISITFQVHPFYIYSMLNGNKIDDNKKAANEIGGLTVTERLQTGKGKA